MIPFTAITYSDGAWTFTWAPALGSVRVVLWGRVLETTTDNEYVWCGLSYDSPTTPPPIEVVPDDGTLAVSEHNACYLTLQWYRVDCSYYVVEGLDGATWYEMEMIPDDTQIPIFTYLTPLMPDQAVAQWRVTARDENNREGDPLNYSWKIVRPPNTPTSPTLGCEAGELTVA